MKITEYIQENESQLETLKSNVWPSADKEHYGENQPHFSNDTFTLVAQDNDELVGYVTVIVDSGVAQIEPLMVKVELKGKGIGTELLRTAEEKAKSLGTHKVWLETGSDWKSKAFYEKHGYIVRTTLPNHTGGREFVLMDKMI
jgi:ribosomal protein S18 acetylase RimI-like enzyme